MEYVVTEKMIITEKLKIRNYTYFYIEKKEIIN